MNEIIQIAAHKYNNSIHSSKKNTPHNILLGSNEQKLTFEIRARQRDANNEKNTNIFRKKDKQINL